jgi:hypothetical protein
VFLGAPQKLSRFGDFNRVAEWIEHGAPGAKNIAKRPSKAQAKERAVATPEETE